MIAAVLTKNNWFFLRTVHGIYDLVIGNWRGDSVAAYFGAAQ
jgi:hypothetical protein